MDRLSNDKVEKLNSEIEESTKFVNKIDWSKEKPETKSFFAGRVNGIKFAIAVLEDKVRIV